MTAMLECGVDARDRAEVRHRVNHDFGSGIGRIINVGPSRYHELGGTKTPERFQLVREQGGAAKRKKGFVGSHAPGLAATENNGGEWEWLCAPGIRR